MPEPLPFDHERAAARFRCFRGRALTLQYIPVGPTVRAVTPDELRREVERAIVAEAGRHRPS
jgi:hypothetical protein